MNDCDSTLSSFMYSSYSRQPFSMLDSNAGMPVCNIHQKEQSVTQKPAKKDD